MAEENPEKLARRAREGDKEAFTALILQNEKMLSRVALSILHDPEDGADAVQEAIFAAWQHIGRLRKPGYFKTWLTRILIRQCYNLLDIRQKHAHSELEAALDGAEEPGGWDTSLDVRAALTELGENDRLVLGLYYSDGLSVRDIAKLLRLSEAAVKQRLHRSRKKFQAVYQEQEGLCHEK